jgi:hypothetical protein
MAISSPLTEALKSGREQFNSSIAEARHRFVNFNTDAFVDFLTHHVDPIIVAVNAISSEFVLPVTVAAYDLAIELISKNLAGPSAKTSAVNDAWLLCGPAYAQLIIKDPYQFLGSLTNAVLKIEGVEGARPNQWIQEMHDISNLIENFEDFYVVGNVIAWRSGLAHLRKMALHAADSLTKEMALAAVNAKNFPDCEALYDLYLKDPWACTKSKQGKEHQTIGKFVGFGGAFMEPPDIRIIENSFYLKSGDKYFELFADSFGAVLIPTTIDSYQKALSAFDTQTNKEIKHDSVLWQNAVKFLPKEFITTAYNSDSVVMYSPYSYAIFITGNDGSNKK